jgi:transcription antitermination factor NusG
LRHIEHQLASPGDNGRLVQRSWFALHTSANHEKKIQQHLALRDVETFLPVHTVTRRWKNRVTAKVELPLFTGYVFVKIARSQLWDVLDLSLVHSVVGSGRGPHELPEDEIEALRAGLREREVDPHPYLKVGDRARIRSGALAGLQGVVIRKGAQLQIVLSIDLISRSIAVHVSADELESLDAPSERPS